MISAVRCWLRPVFVGSLFFVTAACGGPKYDVRVLDSAQVQVAPPSPAPGVAAESPVSPNVPVKTVPARELKPYQRPYTVNGVRYDPMLDHRGYVEEGVASWYGEDFHGLKTSNGEIYDMHAMTAAHKTLPLGVYVKVKNLRNGSEEILRVNDRGPFVKGRIIDLSFAAAKALGVAGPGTAPVRVEALGTRVQDARGQISYQPLPSYDIGSYAVQVGAFTVADNARRLAAEMKSRFGASDIQEDDVNGRRYYRVRVGKFTSLDAAEAAKTDFERSNYPGAFVVAFE
ncbi:septal ring lytic transglycosylase RlpA family protein [Trichloromonas sp.]|uniref:septal ring lytic transglycosylase RlpA family protein n=1 Tax=Trichloromonas sp. TaxID=3069249 RepID=UPI003D81C42D